MGSWSCTEDKGGQSYSRAPEELQNENCKLRIVQLPGVLGTFAFQSQFAIFNLNFQFALTPPLPGDRNKVWPLIDHMAEPCSRGTSSIRAFSWRKLITFSVMIT